MRRACGAPPHHRHLTGRNVVRIAVSACLLGEPCRYDGHAKPCARVQELSERGHELVPICPEVAGGLPTPRTPCEIVRAPWMGADAQGDGRIAGVGRNDDATKAERVDRSWKIVDANGVDRTAAYERGACIELVRATEAGCKLAVFKAKSPSCGPREVYDSTFSGTLVPGQGIAAALFRESGITVIDENADFDQLSLI